MFCHLYQLEIKKYIYNNDNCLGSISWFLIWMNLDEWGNKQTDNLLQMQCITIIIHGSFVYRIKFLMLYIATS